MKEKQNKRLEGLVRRHVVITVDTYFSKRFRPVKAAVAAVFENGRFFDVDRTRRDDDTFIDTIYTLLYYIICASISYCRRYARRTMAAFGKRHNPVHRTHARVSYTQPYLTHRNIYLYSDII